MSPPEIPAVHQHRQRFDEDGQETGGIGDLHPILPALCSVKVQPEDEYYANCLRRKADRLERFHLFRDRHLGR
jgi:hypothetical protein